MRTVSEEEALEIAEVIHELGKKLYSKNGAKFLEEVKKFLNEEPCWTNEEKVGVNISSIKGICIIGGAGIFARAHHTRHDEVFIVDAQMIRESFDTPRLDPELADFPWDRFDRMCCGSLGMMRHEEFPMLIQRLCDDFNRNDLELTLTAENEFFGNRHYTRSHIFQKKHEHFYRSKSHSLKTCDARVFRGPWLARGNIAQF